MPNLDDLLAQKAALEAEIKEVAKQERDDDLKTVKKLIKKHKFTASMLATVVAKGRTRKSA
ncbi:MAG: hypothetical protein AAGF53_17845 [Pseudomonadota bacterium]